MQSALVSKLPFLQLFALRRITKQHSRLVAMLTLSLGLVLSMFVTSPSFAVDLVTFAGVGGPLASALTAIAGLTPGLKAIAGVLGFTVALLGLVALRNFSSVIFFVGLAIFASVGLVIAGAIMGAVI